MKGPLPYIGGKSRLAERLIACFPDHLSYVEPFCGGAQVFFHKPPSAVEVLNDLDGELVNFLRVCQLHHVELLRYLEFSVHSRRWYELHQQQDPAALTDVQRAARFVYLQRTSWGGKVKGQTYNAPATGSGKMSMPYVRRALAATARRLERVQLENLPYEQILTRFDRPTTLFYLDPPYVGMPYYRFNLAANDFQTLSDRLQRLKGKFLLSINDHPVAREAFRSFHRRRVRTEYSVKCGAESAELLFSNFSLPCGLNP